MENISSIYDLSFDELSDLLHSWGEPDYRVAQVWDGLYKKLWSSVDEFTSLPKSMRHNLGDLFTHHNTELHNPPSLFSLNTIRKLESSDGETIKTLFSIPGGQL